MEFHLATLFHLDFFIMSQLYFYDYHLYCCFYFCISMSLFSVFLFRYHFQLIVSFIVKFKYNLSCRYWFTVYLALIMLVNGISAFLTLRPSFSKTAWTSFASIAAPTCFISRFKVCVKYHTQKFIHIIRILSSYIIQNFIFQ